MRKKTKNNKILKKQIGGDVFRAMGNLLTSMTDLGKSIFTEVKSITNIQSDINNVSAREGIPNNLNGPPPYNGPNL
jgi:hypothetical protein